MMKRIVSILTAFVLVLGLMPVGNVLGAEEGLRLEQAPARLAKTVSDPVFGTYVVWRINGTDYESDSIEPEENFRMWSELNDADKKKVTRAFAYYKGARDSQFGPEGSQQMADYINEKQRWNLAGERLRNKIARVKYPMLTEFYGDYADLPAEVQALCRHDVFYAQREQERQEWFMMGSKSYETLVKNRTKVVKQGVLKGNEAILQIITDKLFIPAITPASVAGASTEIATGLCDLAETGFEAVVDLWQRNDKRSEQSKIAEDIKNIETIIKVDLECAMLCRVRSIQAYNDIIDTYNKDLQLREGEDAKLLEKLSAEANEIRMSKEEREQNANLDYDLMNSEDAKIADRRKAEYDRRKAILDGKEAELSARLTEIDAMRPEDDPFIYIQDERGNENAINLTANIGTVMGQLTVMSYWPARSEIREGIIRVRNGLQQNWDICEAQKALYGEQIYKWLEFAEECHRELDYFYNKYNGEDRYYAPNDNYWAVTNSTVPRIQDRISRCNELITGFWYNMQLPSETIENTLGKESGYKYYVNQLDELLRAYDEYTAQKEKEGAEKAARWNALAGEYDSLGRSLSSTAKKIDEAFWGLVPPDEIKAESAANPDMARRHSYEWLSIKDYIYEEMNKADELMRRLTDKRKEFYPYDEDELRILGHKPRVLKDPIDYMERDYDWNAMAEQYESASFLYNEKNWRNAKWDLSIAMVEKNTPMLLRASNDEWRSLRSKLLNVHHGYQGVMKAKQDEYSALVSMIEETRRSYKKAESIEAHIEGAGLFAAENNIPIGGSMTLKASVYPENATFRDVFWESSDPEVAYVDENGRVTGLADGRARISAYAADSLKTVDETTGQVSYIPEAVTFDVKVGSGAPVFSEETYAGVSFYNYGTEEAPYYIQHETDGGYIEACTALTSCPQDKRVIIDISDEEGNVLASLYEDIGADSFAASPEDGIEAPEAIQLNISGTVPPQTKKVRIRVSVYALAEGAEPQFEKELMSTWTAVPEKAETYVLTVMEGSAEGAELMSLPRQYQVEEGAYFTVSAEVPGGMELDSWEVLKGNVTGLPAEPVFRFRMPGEDVTLRAVYREHVHDFGPWKDEDESFHSRICPCHEIEYEPHTYGQWEPQEDGSFVRICTACGHRQVKNAVEPELRAERRGQELILRWDTPDIEGLDHYELEAGDGPAVNIPSDKTEYTVKARGVRCALFAVDSSGARHPFESFNSGYPDETGLSLFNVSVNRYPSQGKLEVLVSNAREYRTDISAVLASYDKSGKMKAVSAKPAVLAHNEALTLEIDSAGASEYRLFIMSGVTYAPLRQVQLIELP